MSAKQNSRLCGAVILPAALMVITVIYLIDALRKVRPLEEGTAGPAFFPIVISIVMIVALLSLVWNGWRKIGSPEKEGNAVEAVALAEPIKVVFLTAGYIAVFKPAGYFLSTAAYVLALLLVFRFKARNVFVNIFWAVIIAGVCFVLFSQIFQIRLPTLGWII